MNPSAEDRAYVRIDGLPSAQVHGETILLSIERQSYFGMRATSERIWQLLAQPQTLTQICGALVGEYEVDPQRCRQEVAVFMEQLAQEQLIRAVSQP